MTNETRNRIEAYKRVLPEMKERVVAAAFLMVMSIMMITSATFAWITLSRAPEVAGMQTTVAANGNLEIALAEGLTKEAAVAPGESQVGDSSAAEDQEIVEANITWGNLVNVSDPTYGLSNIALRPALLSTYNRTDYPLNGATYGDDGRVITTNDRYEFASYELVDGTTDEYYLAAGDKVTYGVRAISSVGYKNVSGNARVTMFEDDTLEKYTKAQELYGKIVSVGENEANSFNDGSGKTCITVLQDLVTVFAQDKLNEMGYGNGEGTKTSCNENLWYLYQMMLKLQAVLNLEGEAILEMANWQAYIASGDKKEENTFSSLDNLLSTNSKTLENMGVKISQLDSYKKSRTDLEYCINGLKSMVGENNNPDALEKTYYWEDIAPYVNRLVEINSTKMNGVELGGSIGLTEALSLLGGGDVVVKKGALVDIERRLVDQDNRVHANVQVTVSTSLIGDKTIKGTVYTVVRTENTDPTYSKDISYSGGLESGTKGDASAKDTYGLALDIWVRTNYPGAVLTLEGAAKYEDQRATIIVEGVKYELSTIYVGEGDAQLEREVYQKNDKWYYADTLSEVSEYDLGEQTPIEKYTPVVVGYEGENRVWEDWRDLLKDGYIEQDATTQGAGSCFIFYADTPTEQAKIMEMLDAFNVAFMDQDGNILGTAKLNLDSAYANQGKVTVPLEVESGTDYTDESGASRKGITKLTQNTPTLITAIVYLNGSKLQNENVLAKGELQGQLNVQFGTDSVLVAPHNEELQAQARSITAEVTVNGQTVKDGTIGGTEGLEYKEGGYPANVKLTVEGEQPERITGYFVRVINATQGTRGKEESFVRNEDGTWSANFNLENPGTYAFNTLIVDGVQYTLHDGTDKNYEPNRPYVYIRGLRVDSASVGVEPGTHMTAESSMNFPVTVKVEAAVEPKQVNAQFFSTDEKKQYTAILTYDDVNDQWVGSANIDSSNTYTLKYISVDGIPMDAPATGSYTLYLGLTARITTTLADDAWTFNYIGPSQITMRARIYDDGGNVIKNLSDVQLVYNNVASPASMTWDSAGYYEGVFDIIQPGELTFKRLELGTVGVIYNVSNSPIFMARSLEKPVYLSASADQTQTVIDGSVAKIEVTLDAAQTASVYAVVEHDPDAEDSADTITTYYIESTGYGNKRTFELPKLDGTWTLKQLWLQDVYDPDYADSEGNIVGKWYAKTTSDATGTEKYTTIQPAGEHFVFDTHAVTTEVVANYFVTLSYDGQEKTGPFTEVFGSAEATFMTSHNSKVLAVEVSDYKGRAIGGVDSVKWEITHNAGTMKSYGGYTGEGDRRGPISMELKDGSTTVYEAPVQEFHVAGQYTSTITVMSGGKLIKSLIEVPTFEVRSKKPTVTISAITPTGSNPAKITYTTKSIAWYLGGGTQPTFTATGNQTSVFDSVNNTATLYAVATADNDEQRHGSFTQPTLTVTIAGVNATSTVSMTLPGGSANDVIFTRTGNGTITRTLGKVTQINSWTSNIIYTHTLSAYTGHGTQEISSMNVTYGGVDYTVPLDTPITINNPSSGN